ncbi:MarC family protein [Parahaliea maris]|uniref:UPF0056 membrane protein n=1 Tax=Parahaliea maris TaxID=2716870 RepID=A0A5C8ZUX9_9GAMM|nr:MarC family protein [Parahaliea maris]TXS91382.1 MarC family protein [Parahaliea maris]
MQEVLHFSTVLAAFFAIMNPVANIPLFIGLTEHVDDGDRRQLATHAVLLAFIIVALFSLLGREIFSLFGITLPAFRIAGGALVGLVGYHLLQGGESSVHTPTAEDNRLSRDAAMGIAVSPLAMPILAGPGTIATAMSFAAEASLPSMLRIIGALAVVCILTWMAFLGAEPIQRFLGRNVIKVVSRLMGLILAVVGVQMMIDGVKGAAALA